MSLPGADLPVRLRVLLRATWLRCLTLSLAFALPPAALSALLAALAGAPAGYALAAALLLLAVVAATFWGARRDARWLLRQLDAACPSLEDSSELLLSRPPVSALAALQRQRLLRRIDALDLPDLRTPWPRGALLVLALVCLAVAAGWLQAPRLMQAATSKAKKAQAPAATVAALAATGAPRIEVRPPAYTGLGARREQAWDVQVPAASALAWSFALPAVHRTAFLVFHDGSRLELRAADGRWNGQRVIEASALYRLEVDDAVEQGAAHRIDAEPDRPPEVKVRAPEQTLTVLEAAQPGWDLAFEASDDYGLGVAELSLILAQGSGENIEVQERTLMLEGRGDARHRRYQTRVDLTELGFAQGDDLIVRLMVADNRSPDPNRTRSASFILRWPPEQPVESAGMEALAQKTMPAYFRSQRQIIIDTEALVTERQRLRAEDFSSRSDGIGVDQKILRLRYGQFLGEEFEPQAAPPTHADAEQENGHADEADEHDAGHEAQDPPAAGGFGQAGDVLHRFGHAHDIEEAATLLDPRTREILRAALNEMWQAEAQLRVATPDAALPYEYKALELIKQVQQATRIYLARTGLDVPQIDETRRLSGKREGLSAPPDALGAARADSPLPALAEALAVTPGQAPDLAVPVDWDGFEAWLAAHEAQVPDALGLRAATERLRLDLACVDCRRDLLARLWPLLPVPAAGVDPRRRPDAAGAAYAAALAEAAP